jgi:hypothetical protein
LRLRLTTDENPAEWNSAGSGLMEFQVLA